MASKAFAVNSSGGTTQAKKVYAVNSSGGTTQAKRGYAVNSSGGTTQIYISEQTLFSGLTQETSIVYGAYMAAEKISSEYSNADGFTSLKVTGTVGAQVTDQGTYGYEANVKIQGWNGSSWIDLKTWNVGGNSSISTAVNESVSINGYTKVRVRCWIRTANIGDGQATNGKCYTTSLAGVAS